MKKFFSKKLWTILTAVFAVLFAAVLIGTYCALNLAYAALHLVFGTSSVQVVNDPNAELSVFYETDYATVDVSDTKYSNVTPETLLEEDAKIIEEVESEGATLLWNKDSALPLSGNEKMSLLSHSSVELVETGSGSGWISAESMNSSASNSIDLKTALTAEGFSVNDTLWNFYKTGNGSKYTRTNPKSSCTEGQTWAVNEVPWNEYTDAVKNTFSSYGDVAIVVLSRSGGEYSDLHFSSTENKTSTNSNGNYLALTTQEKELLQNVKTYKENGTFKKVVLLLNTANPLQFQDLETYYSAIDSCLWIGQVGSFGTRAVAKILNGKVNPSGHLTDTFAYDNESAPAAENDGSYMYAGDCSGLNESGNGIYRQRMYMVYQEGIYVGYKYYETRYEDSVLNQGSANSAKGAKHSASGWDYESEVAVPFGYGGSYTTFEYSNFKVSKDGDNYEVSVTVKNTGSLAGKDAVEVYLQKPYTDYDKANNIEKASVELAGFTKTKLLTGGESETVTVSVPEEYFKTYDANRAETYILEKGTYYLTVGTDAHVAINNILAKKGHGVSSLAIMGDQQVASMGSSFAEPIEIKSDNFTKYSKSTQTGFEIKNQFDSGDINKYTNKGSNEVVYLSRNDWNETYPSTPTLTMTEGLKADLAYDRDPVDDPDIEMPSYGVYKSGNPVIDPTTKSVGPNIKEGDLNVFMFLDAPLYPEKSNSQDVIDGKPYTEYWTDMWNQLLDQMTFEEQALICANAYHQLNGATSITLPGSKQENGPVGITKRSDFPVPFQKNLYSESDLKDLFKNDIYKYSRLIENYYWVAYPCAPIVAATWNTELVERMGQHKSEDMLYLGYNGIYGPGVNMHRSPFGGRNFEYPSEDSLLAGIIEYYESKGIESKGCLAYAKHYALNDMETNRRHVGIWSNEQATREIYLRAFELTFAEGGARATMNSFTRVGARWCGASYAMMTTILRDEWGFEGIVITDWDSGGSMSKVDAILAGTDSFDGNGTASSFDKWRNSTSVAWALRESTKRIIYNVIHTNAMNGKSISTRMVSVTPWWEQAMYNIDIAVGVIFGVCLVLTVTSFIVNKKPKQSSLPDTDDSF